MSEFPGNRLGYTVQNPAARTRDLPNSPKAPVANGGNLVQRHVAAVVIQHLNGTAHLVLVILHPSLNAENYITKIREEYRYALCKMRRSSWSSLFTKSVVGMARIHQVIGQDLETTLNYPTVFISDYSYSDFLSHGWQNSVQHRHYKCMMLPDCLISSPSSPRDCLGKRAIVVRQVLNKTKVAMMLLTLLILGSLLGVVVGMCTGRADVAVAVAAGIFAFVTVLQGLIAWLAA